jgi:hypothetical protein
MTSPQQTAEDIIQSLMNLDGVNELELIMTGIGDFDFKTREKFIERIKGDFDLVGRDEE